jgi:hypothetical protein
VFYSTLNATDAHQMARELTSFSKGNTRCMRPVVHHIFSLADGEQLSPTQWAELAEHYRQRFGIDHCIGAVHGDTGHQHGHFASSRVKLNGRTWSLSHERLRLREFCREMEGRYGLTRTPSRSTRWRVGKDELEKAARLYCEGKKPTPIPDRLAVAVAVKAAMKQCPTLADFEAQLLRQEISTRWRHDEQGQPVGVSFCRGEAAISGRHAGVSCKTLTLHYGAAGTTSHESTHSIRIPSGASRMAGTLGDSHRGAFEVRPGCEHSGVGCVEGTTPRLGRSAIALSGISPEPIKEVGNLLCRALEGMAIMWREDGKDADRFVENMQRRVLRNLVSARSREQQHHHQ